MDPNSNQPIGTNPFTQPIAPQQEGTQSVLTPPPPPIFTPDPAANTPPSTSTPEVPRSGSKKGIILIIILLILAVGMAFYVFFVKNQLNNAQKASTQNTSVIIPTTVPIATPATVDDVNVASPDANLKSIENDVQGL